MKPFRLNRRTVLRGLGAGLALPALEAMLDGRGRFHRVAQAAGQLPPVRFLGFQMQNGCPLTWYSPLPVGAAPLPDTRDGGGSLGPNVISNGSVRYYDPAKIGEEYDLNVANAPLIPHKQELLQITGLHQRSLASVFEHSDGAVACFVGYPMHSKPRDGRAERSEAPSLDWLLGQALAKDVLYPSLYLSLRRDQPRMTNRDYTCSWIGDEQPASPIDQPRVLAEKLTPSLPGPADPTAELERRRARSILDFVRDDTLKLQGQLGANDRARLDQHLTSVREIERQLVLAEMASLSCSAPPNAPEGQLDDEIAMPLMAKLIALGFACDLFRYGIFHMQMAWSLPGREQQDDHSQSHDSWSKDNVYYWDKKMQFFAMILEALKSTPEADKNLLYNSIVMTGVDVAEGWSHKFDPLPVILAGSAGGQIKTGRHLHYDDVTYNNLNCSILNYCGMPVERYGADGTGTLPGLGA